MHIVYVHLVRAYVHCVDGPGWSCIMTVMNTVMLSKLLPFIIRLNETNSSLSLTLILTVSKPMQTTGDEVAKRIEEVGNFNSLQITAYSRLLENY